MARPFTIGQRATIGGPAFWIHAWLEIQDTDGVWRDVTSMQGFDWFDSAHWTEDVDVQVANGQIMLRRQIGNLSLSPLIQGPLNVINRNTGGSYAPFLNPGREFRLSVASVPVGTAKISVNPADRFEMFHGRIDSVNWEQDPIQLDVRDDGAWLQNEFIKNLVNYGTLAGVPMEQVMAQIIADNLPKNNPTLVTPVSPSFNILLFTQQRENLLQALQDLALNIGWDVRYRYDNTGVSNLILLNPPRNKTVPDFAIGPDEYTDVKQLQVSDADVRNYIRIIYASSETGGVGTEVATNNASILEFGEHFYELQQNAATNINTQAQAAQLAGAILNDLGLPNADQQITTLFCYVVQLYDLITFAANGKHYDVDQQFAVLGFTHELSGGSGTTTIKTRGQPAGAYRQWLTRFGLNTLALFGVPNPTITIEGVGSPDGGFDFDGRVWVSITFEPNTEEVYIYSETGPVLPVPVPDESLITLNYIVKRPPGQTAAQPFYAIQEPIATTNGWYRTVKAFGVGYDGQRSVPVVQTVQAGLPNIANEQLPAFQSFSATLVGAVVDMVWALDLSSVPASAVIVITRNGQTITGGGLDQTATAYTDAEPQPTRGQPGFTAETTYTIYLFDPSTGNTGPASTASVGQTATNAALAPVFVTGYPNLFDYGAGAIGLPAGQQVILKWTCTDPNADSIVVEYSTDNQNWLAIWQSATGNANVLAGAINSKQVGPGYYRLATYQGATFQQHSQTVQWTPGSFPQPPAVGNPLGAVILLLTPPSGALSYPGPPSSLLGFPTQPAVVLSWQNPFSTVPNALLQKATALAGPWTTIVTSGYLARTYLYDTLDFATPLFFRIVAQNGPTTVAISNVATWETIQYNGFTAGTFFPDGTAALD